MEKIRQIKIEPSTHFKKKYEKLTLASGLGKINSFGIPLNFLIIDL
jgi:hypothetical protein